MAYFQLIEQYPLGTARGGCYLCGEGGTVESPKVDTGIVIDFEGGLVFCRPCVLQIAELCGLVERHLVDEATASMHELQRVADEAAAERDEMRQLVDLIRRVDERSPAPVVINSPPMSLAEREQANMAKPPTKAQAKKVVAREQANMAKPPTKAQAKKVVAALMATVSA